MYGILVLGNQQQQSQNNDSMETNNTIGGDSLSSFDNNGAVVQAAVLPDSIVNAWKKWLTHPQLCLESFVCSQVLFYFVERPIRSYVKLLFLK